MSDLDGFVRWIAGDREDAAIDDMVTELNAYSRACGVFEWLLAESRAKLAHAEQTVGVLLELLSGEPLGPDSVPERILSLVKPRPAHST